MCMHSHIYTYPEDEIKTSRKTLLLHRSYIHTDITDYTRYYTTHTQYMQYITLIFMCSYIINSKFAKE